MGNRWRKEARKKAAKYVKKNELVKDSDRPTGGCIKSVAYAKYEMKRLGKMGAASSVRIIDPSTLDLSKYLG